MLPTQKFGLAILASCIAIAGATAPSMAQTSRGITDLTCSGIVHGVASNSENQPVHDVQVMLWPIGIDLGYVLPRTTTSAAGEYWFEHVCTGRFTVVVDDEGAGYPPSIWSYLLGDKQGADLKPDHQLIELPVVVPQKAASVFFAARDSRTKTPVRTLEVKLKTSKAGMYDWITFNHNSSEPLLVPSNTDLLCRVVADGYREWRGSKKEGTGIRLAPEGHLTLKIELKPLR
jgi:hypothetical protein